jgi:ATP-binding cassette subfamily B protein
LARSPLPDRPKAKDFRVLRRAGAFLAPYRGRVVGALIALSITVVATLGLGQGLKDLIDSGLSGDDSQALDKALLLLVGLSVIMAFGTFSRFYLVSWLGERVVADLRKAVFDRVLALHPGFFEVTKTGEILSRLTTDTTLLQSVIGSSASMALRSALNFIGGIVMLFVTNAKLAGLVLLVVPIVVIPILIYGRRVRKLSRASQDRVADVGAFAEEAFNAIQTVQAFTHEAEDRKYFNVQVKNAFDTAIRRTWARGLLSAIVILLVFNAIAVILWIGGQRVISGEISGGELAAFVFYASVVAFSVGIISEVFGELQRAAGATERLVELLEEKPEILAPENAIPMPQPSQGCVNFDGVTFHYPSRPDMPALIDFNLHIKSGETVALVGPSGAGKSTVFQLLLRFHDPESGAIVVDGINVSDADPLDVRGHMALVPQDPILFGTNGWENIRYGRPDASDEDVRLAADAAAASEFLDELPDGFGAFLGEKGMRLSGGQRQRISIARAVLRDPAILLLDEATSALDAENERLVQNALGKLMGGRTTIIIAHRLATVLNADRIVVIDKGRMVAIGSHDELIKNNPLYARLAALQFGLTET